MTVRTSIATYAYPDADAAPPASFTDLSAGGGQIRCIGNKYHNGFSGQLSDSVWNGGGAFTADQYAKSVVSGFTHGANGDRIGVSVRCSQDTGAGRDMYRAYVTDAATFVLTLEKVLNNTATSLGTHSADAWVDGDSLFAECIGSTIIAGRNDVALITVTDTALTSGLPGIFAFVGSSDVLRGDDSDFGNSVACRVDSVATSPFADGDTGIVVTGVGFNAAQSTGTIQLISDDVPTTSSTQTVTAWGATSITITVVRGSVPYGRAYLRVTNSDGFVASSFPVMLKYPLSLAWKKA